ncbi:MAG: hypothetical protein KDC71_22020, partial [Acidobacteria bacterium]|nr:hypothetical protein [Acidobacteriota bacterium]
DQSLAVLETVNGTFFDGPEDRKTVFANLVQLKSAIQSGQEGNFLLILKGRENDLTRKLQDTFSYIYLDKVLDGLFAKTERQLRKFQVQDPKKPRASQAELNALLASLKEASEWRYQVKNGTEKDFEPSIAPFLLLSVDPNWDQELAALRGEHTVSQRLEIWFREVYQGSSPKVRSAVIRAMVSRMEGMYTELHLAVGNFYKEQPEMKRYLAKKDLIGKLNQAYDDCQVPGLGADTYHERLAAYAPFFSEDNQKLMAPEGDQYLTLDAIKKATLEALGPAFKSLQDPEARVSGSEKERRELMPDVVTFCNQLLALRQIEYPDPRAATDPRDDSPLTYTEETKSFWDNIVHPYFDEYMQKGQNMKDLPTPGDGVSKNLENLFTMGSERASINKSIFRTNAFKHTALVTNERNRARFEEALDEYYRILNRKNQDAVVDVLQKILDRDYLAVKPPQNRNWSGLIREFKGLTGDGRDFEPFEKGPLRFNDEIRQNFRREVTSIFPEKEDLFEQMKTYLKSVESNLKNFNSSLDELDRIPASELATKRSFYLGRISQKDGLENLAKTEPDPFRVMQFHTESLDEWARAALDAWATKVGGADPCPECRTDTNEIARLYDRMAGQFPVSYSGVVEERERSVGNLVVAIKKASDEDLDAMLEAISRFKNAQGVRADYIKNRRLESFFNDAVLWSDFVQALRGGQVTMSYKLQPEPEATDPITKYFAFSDLEGYYQAKRLSFNSPTFRAIEKNPNSDAKQGVSCLIRLLNDTEGNRSESKLTIVGSELDLFGFVLSNSKIIGNLDSLDKEILFPLNFGNRDVHGVFRFKFSQPIAAPPNWTVIKR